MVGRVSYRSEPFPTIDGSRKTPKFLQIVQGVITNIETGVYKAGDRLPSINEISEEQYLARATVEKAYGSLLKSGHITSLYRKGFFISGQKTVKRVLLVLGKINESNRAIFSALSDGLGKNYKVDMLAYNYRKEFFYDILEKQAVHYQYFVLIPQHLDETEEWKQALHRVPADRLVCLNNTPATGSLLYSTIRYGCGEQLRHLLEEHLHLFRKYDTLNVVTTDNEYIPADWYRVFLDFSARHGFTGQVLDTLQETPIQPGSAYLLFDNDNLVELIKLTQRHNWALGRDIGILSFNDDPLKEVMTGGISVIKTDINQIGRLVSQHIVHGQKQQAYVPLQFIQRASL